MNNISSHELIEVYSAFNGFALYKLDKFIHCNYSHVSRLDNMNVKEVQDNINLLINNYDYNYNAKLNCEHVNFHLDSILKYKSKVCISSQYLFEYNIFELFLFKLLESAYVFYINFICYINGIKIY